MNQQKKNIVNWIHLSEIKKSFLKFCMENNINPSLEIIDCIRDAEKENSSFLSIRLSNLKQEENDIFFKALKENDFIENINLKGVKSKDIDNIIDYIKNTKNIKLLELEIYKDQNNINLSYISEICSLKSIIFNYKYTTDKNELNLLDCLSEERNINIDLKDKKQPGFLSERTRESPIKPKKSYIKNSLKKQLEKLNPPNPNLYQNINFNISGQKVAILSRNTDFSLQKPENISNLRKTNKNKFHLNFNMIKKPTIIPRKPLKISMIMSRMNWLIELKIIYEELKTISSELVSIDDIISVLTNKKNEFVLIDEKTYKQTYSEYGFSLEELIEFLSIKSPKFVKYDDLFNLIGKLIPQSSIKKLNVRSSSSISFMTENSDLFEKTSLQKSDSKEISTKDIDSNKENLSNNVRSSCEHIIETARFNKIESIPNNQINNEEKKNNFNSIKEIENSPQSHREVKNINLISSGGGVKTSGKRYSNIYKNSENNNNSPLSFSISAIKPNESISPKTFTLSEFGNEFLNYGKFDETNSKNKKITKISNFLTHDNNLKIKNEQIEIKKILFPDEQNKKKEIYNKLNYFKKKNCLGIDFINDKEDNIHFIIKEKIDIFNSDLKEIFSSINGLSLKYYNPLILDVKMNNLKYLFINNNNLSEINDLHFNFPNLEYIELNNNCINNVRFLQKCEKLKEIYLKQNKIKNLINISKLQSIKIIDLSHNEIQNFENIALLSFNPSLEKLNLLENPISIKKKFRENVFSLLPSLKFLNENISTSFCHLKTIYDSCDNKNNEKSTKSNFFQNKISELKKNFNQTDKNLIIKNLHQKIKMEKENNLNENNIQIENFKKKIENQTLYSKREIFKKIELRKQKINANSIEKPEICSKSFASINIRKKIL